MILGKEQIIEMLLIIYVESFKCSVYFSKPYDENGRNNIFAAALYECECVLLLWRINIHQKLLKIKYPEKYLFLNIRKKIIVLYIMNNFVINTGYMLLSPY
jgi:hypothetical protein